MTESLTRLNTTSLASRARDSILEAILSQRFDGNRLPSEEELGRMLHVSRTTIRTALHGLEQDGIITRRRALGTTINRHVGPDMLALQRLVGFDRLLAEKGHKVKVKTSWQRAGAPEALSTQFGLEPDEECCLTEKLYFADGHLAIYLRDLISWSEITSPLDKKIPASMFDFSVAYCAHQIDHAVVELVPMVKSESGTTQLELEIGSPFTRLHEYHYSSAGQAVAFSVIDVDDRFIRFEVFRRQPG